MMWFQIGQDLDQDTNSNIFSLKIQVEIVSLTLRVLKEKFCRTTNPIDHVFTFQSPMDFYGAIDAIKC